jgi:transcriptional regulator with XRE-family HTH domain
MEVAMSTLYDRIVSACGKRGVTPGFMCDTLGIRRGYITELKNGDYRTVSCGKIVAMAQFLNVSCDYLILGISELSMDEKDVIDAYRSAPESDKETVRFMLRNYMPIDLKSEEVRLA